MDAINERLSCWDALGTCQCNPPTWSWEFRHGKQRWTRRRGDSHRVYVAEMPVCAGCGYDLRRSPLETLQAMTAKDWNGQVVRGSCFYKECAPGEVWEPFPRDVVGLVLIGCNLDNCTLPQGAITVPRIAFEPDTIVGRTGVRWADMKGVTEDRRAVNEIARRHSNGVACSHARVELQTDLGDWLHKWAGDKAPVRAVDHKARLREGLNVDPAALPAEPLTEEEVKAAEEERISARELAEAIAKVEAAQARLGLPTRTVR